MQFLKAWVLTKAFCQIKYSRLVYVSSMLLIIADEGYMLICFSECGLVGISNSTGSPQADPSSSC